MKVKEVTRLLRTVRRLKPSQVAWRLRYSIERKAGLGMASGVRAPEKVELAESVSMGDFPDVPLFTHPGPAGPETVALLEQGEFLHLNTRLKVGRPKP